jgi:chemotaxis protein MotB
MNDAFEIRVEGHTDDVPIATAQFPSNWELSAARAIQVVKLFREIGISEKRLEAIGYADTRPIAPNRGPAGEALPENMSLNRRVMVRIQRVFQQ